MTQTTELPEALELYQITAIPPAPATPEVPSRRDSGRPGWRAVMAVGAGTAVMASLLTAGGMSVFGGTATTAPATTTASARTSAGAAAAQQSTPLVTTSGTAVNWEAAAAAVEPSVVSVRVVAADGTGDEGSGVILDTSGRILTNNHVVTGAGAGATISVVLADGRTYTATVLGADATTDLAVIQIKNPPSGLKPATFADSSAVKVGDPVMAIGNPLGLSSTVTTGIVSALNRPVNTGSATQQGQNGFSPSSAQQVVTNAIQTDAAINPGNSGGALVDASGRVIGITSSIASLGSSASSQSGSIGLGFAIPANEAKDVATQLIATGTVQHAYLGLGLADGTATVAGAQRSAAVVGSVASGGPAASAGLRTGDAVIAINGQSVDSADSLIAQVRALHPGTSVELTVIRGGQQQTVTLTLGTSPAAAG